MRNAPGTRPASFASESFATERSPVWNAAGRGFSTTVPVADSAWTVPEKVVSASSPEIVPE